LIPYYIQIMVDELCDFHEEGSPIDKQAIEKALSRIIKSRYKHDNYALMYRMRDELPKEYIKMGGELRQTVEEILAEADKIASGRNQES
jgi:hypothetical protein